MFEVRKYLLLAVIVVGARSAAAQSSDIAVSKSGPAQAAAGADVTFTLIVSNGGTDDSTGVTLNDSLPAGMTFVSLTPSTGPGLSCTLPAVGAGGTVNCLITPMTAGQTQSFSLVVNIPAATPAGTVLTNIATVTSATFDPNDENNAASAVVSVPGLLQADIRVAKDGPSSAQPNTDVSYSIVLTNSGPDAATNVTLQDTLPGTMTFVSLVRSDVSFGCNALTVGSGGTLTCTSPSVPAGGTATFTLTGHIPAGENGNSFQNTALVTSDNDPNDENNASTTALVVSSVDVSVTKSGPANATAGTPITYTLTIANGGVDTAADVQLSDPLPAGTTFVSLVQGPGPAGSCAGPPVGTNGTVICSFATFGAGTNTQLTLVVNAGSAVSATNTASVTTSSSDTDPSNDSDSVTTTVAQVADLGVNKIGPSGVVAGSNVSYTVTVSNAGPSAASNVTLSDPVPTGTTFVSSTQTSGPTFSCAPLAVGSGGTINCTLATFAPGASASFTFVVNVPPTMTGAISNTASVSAATSDPNATNDNSTAVTNLSIAPTDVRIVKSANPGIYATGLQATYTITVTNLGPANANGTNVTDVIPVGTTLTSATATQGSCSGTTTVTCNLGTLSPSASATITLVITLPATPGPVSNTASVTTTSGDTNPANDSSTATITVIDAAQIPTLSSVMLLLMALGIAAAGLWLQRGT